MAKQRFVNTRFWSDGFIVKLSPLARYVFLYFLTNEHTNIAGIYELPLSVISTETGIEEKPLLKILESIKSKIVYFDEWVWIKNFQRHNLARGSNKVKIGIDRTLDEIPSHILDKIKELSSIETKTDIPSIPYTYPIDRVSALDSDSDSDSDSDLSDSAAFAASPTIRKPKDEAMAFFQAPPDYLIAYLVEKGIPEPIARQEIAAFVNYWTELNPSGSKQKWQLQKTFEIKRRLVTWMQNAQKFNRHSPAEKKGITI